MVTIEKLNIFGRELVTIEHLKTVTKKSKPIKKRNKLKAVTESKAVDQALELDFLKIHILPKKIVTIF